MLQRYYTILSVTIHSPLAAIMAIAQYVSFSVFFCHFNFFVV